VRRLLPVRVKRRAENPATTETLSVHGSGTYPTPNGYSLPTNAATGTYQWSAVYSGDTNNAGHSFLNDPSERIVVSGAATISGIVYCDNNLNGVYSQGDTLESGATVTLERALLIRHYMFEGIIELRMSGVPPCQLLKSCHPRRHNNEYYLKTPLNYTQRQSHCKQYH
jgi:hypothetical protein